MKTILRLFSAKLQEREGAWPYEAWRIFMALLQTELKDEARWLVAEHLPEALYAPFVQTPKPLSALGPLLSLYEQEPERYLPDVSVAYLFAAEQRSPLCEALKKRCPEGWCSQVDTLLGQYEAACDRDAEFAPPPSFWEYAVELVRPGSGFRRFPFSREQLARPLLFWCSELLYQARKERWLPMQEILFAGAQITPRGLSARLTTEDPIAEYMKLPALVEIELTGRHAAKVFPLLEGLEGLSLQGTLDTHALPFERLRELQRLSLAPETEGIPASVFSLTQLKSLSYQSPLRAKPHLIPEGLGRLSSLEGLWLKGTPIGGLPATVGQLKELRTLSIHCFRFQGLPEEIGDAEKLETIEIIAASSLPSLPDSLARLKGLSRLSVGYLSGAKLPPVLFQMPWLTVLGLISSRRYSSEELAALTRALPNTKIRVGYTADAK